MCILYCKHIVLVVYIQMVFFFLLDAIASTALYITVKCGTWIVYGTANGVYYVYKKIKPSSRHNYHEDYSMSIVRIDANIDNVATPDTEDYDCVILKRDEYEKLISNNSTLRVKIE